MACVAGHHTHTQTLKQDLLAVSYGDTAPVPINPGRDCRSCLSSELLFPEFTDLCTCRLNPHESTVLEGALQGFVFLLFGG